MNSYGVYIIVVRVGISVDPWRAASLRLMSIHSYEADSYIMHSLRASIVFSHVGIPFNTQWRYPIETVLVSTNTYETDIFSMNLLYILH